MLQIFENEALNRIAKPAPARNTILSVLIHTTVLVLLLSLGLSPAMWQAPQNLVKLTLLAPGPPMAPPPPPPPPAAVASIAASHPQAKVVRVFQSDRLVAPVAVPTYNPMTDVVIELPMDIGVPGGVPGGLPTGFVSGVGTAIGEAKLPAAVPPPPPPPSPPPPPPPPVVPQRVQVNAAVQEARIVKMVRPEYPPAAKAARIQGEVRLEAVIDREGKVVELKVLDGHPLLVNAAQVAVLQWRYRPTLLNDTPVEVATEILVTFRLV